MAEASIPPGVEVAPTQLARELQSAVGSDNVEVAYSERDQQVTADVPQATLDAVLAAHVPDPLALWPDWQRRLFELLEKEEAGTATVVEIEESRPLVRRWVLSQLRQHPAV